MARRKGLLPSIPGIQLEGNHLLAPLQSILTAMKLQIEALRGGDNDTRAVTVTEVRTVVEAAQSGDGGVTRAEDEPTVVSTPTQFTATPLVGAVLLTWVARPAGQWTQFNIRRGLNNIFAQSNLIVVTHAQYHVDYLGDDAREHWYWVQGQNETLESAWSQVPRHAEADPIGGGGTPSLHIFCDGADDTFPPRGLVAFTAPAVDEEGGHIIDCGGAS